MTSTAACEAPGETLASMLEKSGLRGRRASADCGLGRQVWEAAEAGRGTLLHGEPGTGKTWAAACCCRLWVERRCPSVRRVARLATFRGLLDEERDGYGEGSSARGALRDAESLPLLVLDDLGAERVTAWTLERLTALLDARDPDASKGLVTVVTSNLRVGALRDLYGGTEGKRIASRLCGMCDVREVLGPDRRLAGRSGVAS